MSPGRRFPSGCGGDLPRGQTSCSDSPCFSTSPLTRWWRGLRTRPIRSWPSGRWGLARPPKPILPVRRRWEGCLRRWCPTCRSMSSSRRRCSRIRASRYDYVERVAAAVRAEIGLGASDVLDFEHLIGRFRDLQAVLIPVLWGARDRHENALHIHLPESATTWVYLNLDSEAHDFKFWMAHELAHVLAPRLRGDEGEDFADSLASALLCPRQAAEAGYRDVRSLRGGGARMNAIKGIAGELTISPITVHERLRCYAESEGLPVIDLGNASLRCREERQPRVSDRQRSVVWRRCAGAGRVYPREPGALREPVLRGACGLLGRTSAFGRLRAVGPGHPSARREGNPLGVGVSDAAKTVARHQRLPASGTKHPTATVRRVWGGPDLPLSHRGVRAGVRP